MSLKTNTNRFNCYYEDEMSTAMADYDDYKNTKGYEEILIVSDLVDKIIDVA